jgi:CubicO group peptidase (beta-lactamase class C family)
LPVLVAAILLLGAVAAIFLGGSKGPRKPEPIPIGDYTYAIALAEHSIEQVMEKHHIPGAAAALIVDQQIIWEGSFGQATIDPERPVADDTVFKMWSLAKPFTAIEVMRLVEEGTIDLDTPIEMYVPDYAIQSRFPDGESTTIRHILAHRSGLPRGRCLHETRWPAGFDATESLADSLEECFQTFPTGTRYKYSNAGFDVLGAIIQDKRGQDFRAYMKKQLLVPIGMSNSAFWSTDLPKGSAPGEDRLASGYEFFEGEHYAYEQYDIASVPSGNLYATAGDLANLIQFIFRGGEVNGDHIIGAETLASMFEDQYSRPADPQRMGLGWKIGLVSESEKMVWHDGGPSEGIGSLIAFLPERKLGLVLLANSTSFDGSVSAPLAIELLEAMQETAYGLAGTEEEPPDLYPVEPVVLQDYQGSYAAFGEIMEVVSNGDRLKASIQGMSFDLEPVAENRFRPNHWLYKLGLADLLQLPIDLRELEIEFQMGEETGQDIMVINMGGISYEMCPRYPDLTEDETSWEALAGKYERYGRLPSGNSGQEKLGEIDLTIIAGRLHMSGAIGPVLPIDDETIVILSGPFNGETISYDPESGILTHQGFIYKPVQSGDGTGAD